MSSLKIHTKDKDELRRIMWHVGVAVTVETLQELCQEHLDFLIDECKHSEDFWQVKLWRWKTAICKATVSRLKRAYEPFRVNVDSKRKNLKGCEPTI